MIPSKFMGSGGGGGAAWGSITGTLSNQTDLNTALGARLLSGLGTTPTAAVSLVNSTAAAAGAQQVSPALVLEGQGWRTNATAESQTVRFRQYVLPVQGTANPSATWVLQSEINNSGTWVDRLSVPTTGAISTHGATLGAGNFSVQSDSSLFAGGILRFATDTFLVRDAANIMAQRNGTNAQEYRVYGTFTDASNHRRLAMGMSTGGVAFLRAEGAGTGASGNVLHISSLPTSNPGPGILWNNAGTPAIGT